METKMKILSIGAHPDDADTSAAGLLLKLRDAGWEVRLLSLTDGSAGTYHMEMSRKELALMRRDEAAASGHLLGGRYDVWDIEDGRLEPTLENRERLIRYIRRFAPDVIVTNRPNDYHADHRNASLLVQDASYLLTVPRICEDTQYMEHTPLILFWGDSFEKPNPHRADVFVPVSAAHIGEQTCLASCHVSQYFDWMYWPDHTERLSWPREKQTQDLNTRYLRITAAVRDANQTALEQKYGADASASIRHLECFEISEYGDMPTEEFLRVAEAAE